MTLINFVLTNIVFFILILISWKRSRSFLNPFSLIVIFFFFPMTVASVDLGKFFITVWEEDTLTLFVITIIAWGLFPFVWVCRKPKPINQNNTKITEDVTKLYKPFVYLLSFVYIFLYFIENQILTGSLFPIASGGVEAHEAHVLSAPVIGIITRAGSVIACLILLGFKKNRSYLEYLYLLFIVLIPLSRGSRLDIVFSLVAMTILWYSIFFNVIKTRTKLLITIAGISLVGLMSFIGTYRSLSLDSNYSYASNLGFESNNILLDIAAPLYGNFALPFINLNRFVAANKGEYTNGEFSILPISATLINFPEILGSNDLSTLVYYEDPITPNGVSTALAYFYKDFGPIIAIIPLLIYMYFWLWLFGRRYKGGLNLIFYSLYSSAFCMSAFMAFIINPALYRRLIIVFILFKLLEFFKNYRQNKLHYNLKL